MKVQFKDIGVGRRFRFKKMNLVKISESRGATSSGHIEYVAKDRIVELLDSCERCKYWVDLDCQGLDLQSTEPHSEAVLNENYKTFTCSNFVERKQK